VYIFFVLKNSHDIIKMGVNMDNNKRFGDYSTDRNYSIIKIKEYFDNRYNYITKGE
jgi:hypothetical protein